MEEIIKIPTRPKRKFVNEDLVIDSWKKIEPYFENLLNISADTIYRYAPSL